MLHKHSGDSDDSIVHVPHKRLVNNSDSIVNVPHKRLMIALIQLLICLT